MKTTTEVAAKRFLRVYREAVAQALERHRRLEQSIAVWQEGKVVILEADQIPLPQSESQLDEAP